MWYNKCFSAASVYGSIGKQTAGQTVSKQLMKLAGYREKAQLVLIDEISTLYKKYSYKY